VDHLKGKINVANKQVNELEKRLKESTVFRGITLDETSNSDFLNVTGFVKRGLPHTFNCTNLKDHNLMFKKHATLKFSTSIKLC